MIELIGKKQSIQILRPSERQKKEGKGKTKTHKKIAKKIRLDGFCAHALTACFSHFTNNRHPFYCGLTYTCVMYYQTFNPVLNAQLRH